MSGWGFALAGAAAGLGQAGLLAAAARGGRGASALVPRLALVGLVLALGARAGHLAPAAAGWLAAFLAACAAAHRRLP